MTTQNASEEHLQYAAIAQEGDIKQLKEAFNSLQQRVLRDEEDRRKLHYAEVAGESSVTRPRVFLADDSNSSARLTI